MVFGITNAIVEKPSYRFQVMVTDHDFEYGAMLRIVEPFFCARYLAKVSLTAEVGGPTDETEACLHQMWMLGNYAQGLNRNWLDVLH